MDVKNRNLLKEKVHEVIFEADTKEGKLFDIILLFMIIASVVSVMLETVPSLDENLRYFVHNIEWIFTIFFTIEYGLRIYCVYKPKKYILSFFGIIDLLAILPSYLSLIFFGTQSLVVIRALRLLRIFRIFKMLSFLNHGHVLLAALRASRPKILIFLTFLLIFVSIMGSIIYLIEGGNPDSGFDSIPRSVYWAIVTMTTVGYGDIHPRTEFGQFFAALIMICGYAIIAVPTGIVSSELTKDEMKDNNTTQACRFCSEEGHDSDATFCKYCGELLNDSGNN